MAKLYFHYSTMNAGKSTILLQAAHNYQERGMQTYLLTAKLDDRAGAGRIASRIGIGQPAETFTPDDDLFARIAARLKAGPCACIFIDEAQFLDDGIIPVVNDLADRGVRVILSGTDMDFRGMPFGPIPGLLAIAEQVDKLHAICVRCGELATRNQRLLDGLPAPAEGPTIQVGGSEHYEARCRRCHEVPPIYRDQTSLLDSPEP